MKEQVLTKSQSKKLYTSVKTAVSQSAKADFDLCWLLYESDRNIVYIDDEPFHVWQHWGYKSWFDFVEKTVGVHVETARRYKKIGKVFGEELADCWDTGNPLPITKMAILASWSGLNAKNVKTRMEWASKRSCCQIQEELGLKDYLQQVSFAVTPEEKDKLNEAIDLMREVASSEDNLTRGEIISMVAQEWISTAKNRKKKLRAAS